MTVSHGCNHDEIATDKIGDVVGKNGAVDSESYDTPCRQLVERAQSHDIHTER